MTKERKVWSPELKLQIIREAAEHGFEVTQRKYGFYSSLYYRWLKDYRANGEDGLKGTKPKAKVPVSDPEKQTLKEKIELLEHIVAQMTLQLALRDEVIKKKYPTLSPKMSFE